MTAQQSVPTAISEPGATTAEGFVRAIAELVIKPAMIGAVRAEMVGVGNAMVAESPWKHFRTLPVRRNKQTVRGQPHPRAGGWNGCPSKADEYCERKGFHRPSPQKYLP